MSIVLNVSGNIFNESNLYSPLFNNMINDSEIDNIVIIERSNSLFKHVYPAKYRSELDYYLVEYDIKKLHKLHADLKRDEYFTRRNSINKRDK